MLLSGIEVEFGGGKAVAGAGGGESHMSPGMSHVRPGVSQRAISGSGMKSVGVDVADQAMNVAVNESAAAWFVEGVAA